MIRLSCISLFSKEPKLDNFLCKKNVLLVHAPPRKVLVALLVAFTTADRFFKRLYGPHTNELRNAASLFLRHECKISKIAHISSRKISFFLCKSSVYFSAPSLCLLWRRHCCLLFSCYYHYLAHRKSFYILKLF